MSRAWFAYIGPLGGELNPTNYRVSTLTPTCLDGSQNICAINAVYQPETYGAHPGQLSANIINYLSNLKITSSAQPKGSKKYVYSYPA